MSTNATQQIEGSRLNVAAAVTPGSTPASGRSMVTGALSTPMAGDERNFARVQLADASRLGPGGDRNKRDFSFGFSVGQPGYYTPGYVVPGPVLVAPPPVLVAPPVYGPYYGPTVVYPQGYRRCNWLESLFDWNSFGRGRHHYCR